MVVCNYKDLPKACRRSGGGLMLPNLRKNSKKRRHFLNFKYKKTSGNSSRYSGGYQKPVKMDKIIPIHCYSGRALRIQIGQFVFGKVY